MFEISTYEVYECQISETSEFCSLCFDGLIQHTQISIRHIKVDWYGLCQNLQKPKSQTLKKDC